MASLRAAFSGNQDRSQLFYETTLRLPKCPVHKRALCTISDYCRSISKAMPHYGYRVKCISGRETDKRPDLCPAVDIVGGLAGAVSIRGGSSDQSLAPFPPRLIHRHLRLGRPTCFSGILIHSLEFVTVYCDQPVCLSVREHISGTARP